MKESLKQRQKQEIQRLKRICFPPKDSPPLSAATASRSHAALQLRQECDRILSNLPTQTDFQRFQTAMAGRAERNHEKKFRSLERNFQRFSERHSSWRSLLPEDKENQNFSQLDISPIRAHSQSFFSNAAATSLIDHRPDTAATVHHVCDEISTFFRRILTGMAQMAVTNSQEIELKKRLTDHLSAIDRFRAAVTAALEAGDHTAQSLAFEQLLRAFNVAVTELAMRFEGLLSKIAAVSSQSFQRYKSKDICALFDTLCEQFHRFHVLDFAPLLAQKYTSLRASNGLAVLSRIQALHGLTDKRRAFLKIAALAPSKEAKLRAQAALKRVLQALSLAETRRLSGHFARWTRQLLAEKGRKHRKVQDAGARLLERLVASAPERATLFRETAKILETLLNPGQKVQFIGYDATRRVAYRCGKGEEEQVLQGESLLGQVVLFHEIMNTADASKERHYSQTVDKPGSLLYFPVLSRSEELVGVLRVAGEKKMKFATGTLDVVGQFAQAVGGVAQSYLRTERQISHLRKELESVSERSLDAEEKLQKAEGLFQLCQEAALARNKVDLYRLVRRGCEKSFGSQDVVFSLYVWDAETQQWQHVAKKSGEREPLPAKGSELLLKAAKSKKLLEKRESRKNNEEIVFTAVLPLFSATPLAHPDNGRIATALVKLEKSMSPGEAKQHYFANREGQFADLMGAVVKRVLELSDAGSSVTLRSDNVLLARRLQLAEELEDALKQAGRSFDGLQEMLGRVLPKHFPQLCGVRLFLRARDGSQALIGLAEQQQQQQQQFYTATSGGPGSFHVTSRPPMSGEHSRRVSLLAGGHKWASEKPPGSRGISCRESMDVPTQLPSGKVTASYRYSSRRMPQSGISSPPPEMMTSAGHRTSASGLGFASPVLQDFIVPLDQNSVLCESAKLSATLNIGNLAAHPLFAPSVDLPAPLATSSSPFSALYVPIANSSDEAGVEGILQLLAVPEALGVSGFSEEQEFIVAAASEKLRGVVAAERAHTAETLELRGKLEQAEAQLAHSENANSALLALNTFIGTQLPTDNLGLFATSAAGFLTSLFSCECARLLIVDSQTDSLLEFCPSGQPRTIYTGLEALVSSEQGGLAAAGLRTGNCLVVGGDQEMGKAMVEAQSAVEWMDLTAFSSLSNVQIDLPQQGEYEPQNCLQAVLPAEAMLGVIQLFNRADEAGGEFNNGDVALLGLTAQTLAPTLWKLRSCLQPALSSRQLCALQSLADTIRHIKDARVRGAFKEMARLRARERKLGRLAASRRLKTLLGGFGALRRRCFELSVKEKALSMMRDTLGQSGEVSQLSPESFRDMPLEFKALSCLPGLLTAWSRRQLSQPFARWMRRALTHSRQMRKRLQRRDILLRSLTKCADQRRRIYVWRKAERAFARWKHIGLRGHSSSRMLRRVLQKESRRSLRYAMEQWERVTLLARCEAEGRVASKTQALRRFLRLRERNLKKHKQRALQGWLGRTRAHARAERESQLHESALAEHMRRQQQFLNALYESCFFFAHSESAGLRQIAQQNSFSAALNSPQVRAFFQLIRNYLSAQLEFTRCVFSLNLPFLPEPLFCLALANNDASLQLFTSRSRDMSTISELMKGIDLSSQESARTDESAPPVPSRLLAEPDPIHTLLSRQMHPAPISIEKLHRQPELGPALFARGAAQARSGALVPLTVPAASNGPIPAFVGAGPGSFESVGSLELYRGPDGNKFTDQELNCLHSISNAVAPCVLAFNTALRHLHGELGDQRGSEADSQMRSLRERSTLSGVSRFLVEKPELFQKAERALLIHLPAGETTTAFFYSFADSHIYNFEYSGSFIEQVALTHIPVMFEHSKSVTQQADPGAPIYHFVRYLPILSSASPVARSMKDLRNILAPQKTRVVAVLELCHEEVRVDEALRAAVRPEELGEKEVELTAALGGQLCWIRDKVKTFVSVLGAVERLRRQKAENKALQVWKKAARRDNARVTGLESQILEIEGSVAQYESHIQEFEAQIQKMEGQLEESARSKALLVEDLESMKLEKKAKLKFLAAALLFGQLETASAGALRAKNYFDHWKAHAVCLKIAESAFNKVLELNHKHALARFHSATFLLSSFARKFKHRMRYFSFRSLMHHAALTHEKPLRQVLASHSGVLTRRQHTPPPRRGAPSTRRSLSKENSKPHSPYVTPTTKRPAAKRGSSSKRHGIF